MLPNQPGARHGAETARQGAARNPRSCGNNGCIGAGQNAPGWLRPHPLHSGVWINLRGTVPAAFCA
eukprot:2648618-Lingulodinium_polyedra.AAC.1